LLTFRPFWAATANGSPSGTGRRRLRISAKMGVLPEALVNYLVLLGWAPPEVRGIFSREETGGGIFAGASDTLGRRVRHGETVLAEPALHLRVSSPSTHIFSFWNFWRGPALLARVLFPRQTGNMASLSSKQRSIGFPKSQNCLHHPWIALISCPKRASPHLQLRCESGASGPRQRRSTCLA